MLGIERQFLRECVEALCNARNALLELTCEEAISRSKFGKGDTLYLDAAPELAIIKALCEEFDKYLPLITEEVGSSDKLRGIEHEAVFFSDPMDRSKILAQFLLGRNGKLAAVFSDEETVDDWENRFGGNIELSGPYGSITAIRHNNILFNVMINYITGTIYVASDANLGKISMSDIYENGDEPILKRTGYIINNFKPISFGKSLKDPKKFVTFCEGSKYEDNLISSGIFEKCDLEEMFSEHVVLKNPGGPARILYLQSPPACSFILANGEKIGEWLGWLAYVKYSAGKLRAYEISFDKTWTRDQILMAPGPAYSILVNDILEDKGLPYANVQVNMLKLQFLDNPSRYRSTLLICPETNREIIMKMSIQKRVELRFI